MRNAKLIVPVILVVAVAALIGALAARSMGDSHKQAVVKTRMVSAEDAPGQPPRPDALSPERRAERALHLHERGVPRRCGTRSSSPRA